MLVLSRRPGQKLILANDIEILVLEVKGESVKIGIKAPKSVWVYREEIYEEIKKANQLATAQQASVNLDQAFQMVDQYQLGKSKETP